jgi:hypothetical protein
VDVPRRKIETEVLSPVDKSAAISTLQMSCRRQETKNASLAAPLPKTEALAAVSSIWLVGLLAHIKMVCRS